MTIFYGDFFSKHPPTNDANFPSQFILINGHFFVQNARKKITMMVSIIHMYKNGRRTLKCSSNTINQAQIRTMCNVHHHNTKKIISHQKKDKKATSREKFYILYFFAWHSSKIFIFFASAPLLGSSNMHREKNCAGFFHLISHSHINLIFMHIFFSMYACVCVCLYNLQLFFCFCAAFLFNFSHSFHLIRNDQEVNYTFFAFCIFCMFEEKSSSNGYFFSHLFITQTLKAAPPFNSHLYQPHSVCIIITNAIFSRPSRSLSILFSQADYFSMQFFF